VFPVIQHDEKGQLSPGAIERAVEERLCQTSYLELRRLSAAFEKGVLTLNGYVSSYYLRQIAQAAVRDLEGIEAIDNRIEVISGLSNRNHGGG
jgi:osmotically-inducible protein OsmY